MNKVSCVVSCPADTYSGYGARSRDFVKALIQAKPDWNIKILSQRWGNTRFGYIKDHNERDLDSRIITKLTEKPDVWVQITVANEFANVGRYNIGVTAGIETTLCHSDWIFGCNKMDLILVSSEHSKNVLEKTVYTLENNKTGETQELKVNKPIKVLFEGVDLDKYTGKAKNKVNLPVKEDFCFLTMGHWMKGNHGHDRKNISYTIKAFLETFKNSSKQPALLVKTSSSNPSVIDRENILDRIENIRKTVKGTLPPVYLIHGDMTDEEINSLYNHSKVKAMVSLTKGEGFGRPLLEFTTTGKPVIASNWSGQTDFLNPEYARLVGGELEQVDESASSDKMIMKEGKWFKPNDKEVSTILKSVFENYKDHLSFSRKHKKYTKDNFSYEKMVGLLDSILTESVPEFPKLTQLKLPKLQLPKLEKID